MSSDPVQQQYLVTYGPDANCTLEICPVEASVYEYRPSIPASTIFIVLFSLSMLVHIAQGMRYKTWFFMSSAVLGCITEIIGYAGRIMLWQNPFSFNAFLMQICCITFAPVFYAAAIYTTLTRVTNYLDPSLCRFPPSLYYWLFIPCDLVSLVLQATGGALTSSSQGSSNYANNISLAGLSFQVFTLLVFIVMASDYVIRYARSQRRIPAESRRVITTRLQIFAAFFSFAILVILIRCAYRIDELSEGYSGPLIHNEGLFIALEGVMIVLATFALNIGHPGLAFQNRDDGTVRAQASALGGKDVSGFESESSGKERV